MHLHPIITHPNALYEDGEEARKEIADALPKSKNGWRYVSAPFGGPPLRFANETDMHEWADSFENGHATVEPKFVFPYIKENDAWKTNPEYLSAPFEVVIFTGEPI